MPALRVKTYRPQIGVTLVGVRLVQRIDQAARVRPGKGVAQSRLRQNYFASRVGKFINFDLFARPSLTGGITGSNVRESIAVGCPGDSTCRQFYHRNDASAAHAGLKRALTPKTCPIKLYLAATNVRTGKIKLFLQFRDRCRSSARFGLSAADVSSGRDRRRALLGGTWAIRRSSRSFMGATAVTS